MNADSGDEPDDFVGFVHATATQLYRTAFLLTGDHHLAEDLTQSAYAKVFASWRRVRGAGNPVGYARTIVVNTFLSHRRLRRNSEIPSEALGAAERPAAHETDPATRLDLLAALQLLSPSDRAVLVLRYWEDRSVTQTARDLGISEAAVRTRARRALERLRPRVRDSLLERTTS